MNKKITVIIENISEGKQKGFMATIPELNNSIVFGDNLHELMEAVESTIDVAQKYGIGILAEDKSTITKSVVRHR